jgi:hypothetical protein
VPSEARQGWARLVYGAVLLLRVPHKVPTDELPLVKADVNGAEHRRAFLAALLTGEPAFWQPCSLRHFSRPFFLRRSLASLFSVTFWAPLDEEEGYLGKMVI